MRGEIPEVNRGQLIFELSDNAADEKKPAAEALRIDAQMDEAFKSESYLVPQQFERMLSSEVNLPVGEQRLGQAAGAAIEGLRFIFENCFDAKEARRLEASQKHHLEAKVRDLAGKAGWGRGPNADHFEREPLDVVRNPYQAVPMLSELRTLVGNPDSRHLQAAAGEEASKLVLFLKDEQLIKPRNEGDAVHLAWVMRNLRQDTRLEPIDSHKDVHNAMMSTLRANANMLGEAEDAVIRQEAEASDDPKVQEDLRLLRMIESDGQNIDQ